MSDSFPMGCRTLSALAPQETSEAAATAAVVVVVGEVVYRNPLLPSRVRIKIARSRPIALICYCRGGF